MLKRHFQKAVKALVTLSSKGLGTSSLSDLAKDMGFKTAADRDFKEVLAALQREGVIEVQQSGFVGDSMHHRKIVVLKADLVLFHADEAESFREKDQNPYSLLEWKNYKEAKNVAPQLALRARLVFYRFFQLLCLKRFGEAARILREIEKKMMGKNEWHRGYFLALNGMLLAAKTKDAKTFLCKINLNEKEMLRRLRIGFIKKAKSELSSSYDRGFFCAWADFIGALQRAIKKKLLKPYDRLYWT